MTGDGLPNLAPGSPFSHVRVLVWSHSWILCWALPNSFIQTLDIVDFGFGLPWSPWLLACFSYGQSDGAQA